MLQKAKSEILSYRSSWRSWSRAPAGRLNTAGFARFSPLIALLARGKRVMGLRSHHDLSPRAWFGTTHWSLVLAARGHGTPEAREALAALCETYWYPLYAFVRRKGYDRDRAQDLVQGFFLRLLEKDDLSAVAPAKEACQNNLSI